ncbi:MAG: glycosyltransferase family 39 protein [Rhodocyclaceae bacterium]|nr:glycosyltransferase family 39 protein [Rhodocyclaceae bacterium]
MAGLMTSPRRLFLLLLPLTLAFRFWLAAAMPITGDEAYFIWWGKIPDWGFYDHPPIVGWLLAALLLVSDAEWWLRLPAILQPAVLGLATAATLASIWGNGRDNGDRAWWAAVLVLLAPASVWNVFITTDTPLVYFSVLSGLAWVKATQDDESGYGWFVVCGVLLAGAVLSKYFVALLGFAYLIHALCLRRRRVFAGLLIAYACCLPALGLMAWWNAGHCWPNYMFNFVNRHEGGGGLSWQTPLLYAATLAYLLTPPGLWLLMRRGDGAVGRGLAVLSFVPFLLFALLSVGKKIGLHWLLSFLPFALAWLALRLPAATLNRLGYFFVAFAGLHVAGISVVANLPLETWKPIRIYDGVVLTIRAPQLIERLKPYEAEFIFTSDGYSNAVTLGYNARRYFAVFGIGSSHARHDDILTDWYALDGKNILTLRKTEPTLADYQPYFSSVEIKRFEEAGAPFWIVLGRGFHYETYRDRVLTEIRQRWYALPGWLPQTRCYFCDRYFGGETCRRS